MTQTTQARTALNVDHGPVHNAAVILVQDSTLAEHVIYTPGHSTALIEMRPDDVPFELWGSGTQALWRLLSAMAYTNETVSLYEVVARLDTRNRLAVAGAMSALCGA